MLFLQPDSSCHLRRKTCCLPIIAAILFTYLCAIVIVGTLVARLNVFKSVLNNTSLNSPFQPAGKAFLVGVKANNSPRRFHESAIGQHLLDNPVCASHYNDDKFSILARGRSLFHLSALEATFIKSLKPVLCKQKDFVYSLKLS